MRLDLEALTMETFQTARAAQAAEGRWPTWLNTCETVCDGC